MCGIWKSRRERIFYKRKRDDDTRFVSSSPDHKTSEILADSGEPGCVSARSGGRLTSSANCLPWRLELPAQPLAGHVQTPLDRADRRLELAAHLLERSAANVKRLQRLPVQGLEAVQTVP